MAVTKMEKRKSPSKKQSAEREGSSRRRATQDFKLSPELRKISDRISDVADALRAGKITTTQANKALKELEAEMKLLRRALTNR
jgi:septal ring factor EnvC (AmiA/AmiB activator)